MSSHDAPDFVIVTPLEEEREAVLNLLPSVRRLPPDERDIRIYYTAELRLQLTDGTAGTYKIVVASPLGMGRVEAASATMDAIHRFQPRFVLIVGIAGGVADGVSLGDVLVADQFVDYESQKLTDRGAQIRYQAYRADPRLLVSAQHLRDWQKTVAAPRPDKNQPRRHIGPVASGDKVIATRSGIQEYLQDWPKLLGVEMEAGGVAGAAFQAASKPGVLMIRGVSDAADAHKNSQEVGLWRQYACEVAAAYALALLRSGPVPFVDLARSKRKKAAARLAEQLQISPQACDIILDKPKFWEQRLFGQVLSDELSTLAGLTRDYQLGISIGSREYVEASDLLLRVREANRELLALMQALDGLINVAYREAVGPPGVPGDPEALVYTARRIANVYEQSLLWAIEWNRYDVEEDCRMLLTLLGQAPVGILEGIRKFDQELSASLLQLDELLSRGEPVVLGFNLDIGSSSEFLSHITDEVKRIQRRLAFKFW